MAAAQTIYNISSSTVIPPAPPKPTIASDGEQKVMTFLDVVFEYMTEILNALVQLSSDETATSQTQTMVANSSVELAKDQVDKAQQQLSEYIAELARIAAAEKAAFIGSIIKFVFMAAASLATCDPVMITMIAAQGAMQFGGGDKALQGALSSIHSDVGRMFADIAVDIGIAVVCCVVGGVLGAAGETILANIGKKVIADGVAKGAGDAAEDAGANEADAEANEAPANQPVEQPAEQPAANQTSFGQKVWKNGFSKGNFVMNMGMATQMANPFVDLVLACMPADSTDDEKKRRAEISQLVGMVLSLFAMFAAGGYSAYSSSGAEADTFASQLQAKMAGKLSGAVMTKLEQIFTLGMFIAGITTGAYQIEEGEAQKKVAAILRKMGATQANISMYMGLLDQIDSSIQQTQSTYKNLFKNFAMMNSRWDSYVEPGRIASSVLG